MSADQLCVLGLLPRDLNIVAFGRKHVDREAFLERQTCNVREDPRMSKDDFCSRIVMHVGGYDAPEAFVKLAQQLAQHESEQHAALVRPLKGLTVALCGMASMKTDA